MNNIDIMDSSSRIKLERQKRSWTQEQLAERAKLSTRTVQRIESGDESSAETLRLIAEAFGLPPESLRSAAVRTHFGAPWSRFVKIITVLVIAVVAALPFFLPGGRIPWLDYLLWGVVVFCLFFSVSGYTIKDGRLLVHRLGWSTKLELAQLSAFSANPHAMKGSIRLFGSAGLFCIIGYYRNGVLGNYRAYVTDSAKSVVLEFSKSKIVVSPDDPQAFVETLRDATKGIVKEPAAPDPIP